MIARCIGSSTGQYSTRWERSCDSEPQLLLKESRLNQLCVDMCQGLHCPHYNVYDAKQDCKDIFDSNSDPTFSKLFGSYSHCNFLNLYGYNSDSDSSYLKTFDSDSVKSKKQLRFRLFSKVGSGSESRPITLLPTLPIHCLHCPHCPHCQHC